MRKCYNCGTPANETSEYCIFCGKKLMSETFSYKMTNKPIIGGLFCILGGIFSIILMIMLLWILTTQENIAKDDTKNICISLGFLSFISSFFSIVAGFLALQRKKWEFTIIFAVLGILGGAILTIIGLLFIATCKNEFESNLKTIVAGEYETDQSVQKQPLEYSANKPIVPKTMYSTPEEQKFIYKPINIQTKKDDSSSPIYCKNCKTRIPKDIDKCPFCGN